MLSHQKTGQGAFMEMITCSSDVSSDNGGRGIYGEDNEYVFCCSLIRQRGQGAIIEMITFSSFDAL